MGPRYYASTNEKAQCPTLIAYFRPISDVLLIQPIEFEMLDHHVDRVLSGVGIEGGKVFKY